jgi:hypothetical protein
MIKQECTFYPETYNIKSYKEFNDDNLIVHTEYDEDNNKVYMEFNYPDKPTEWMRRKFKEGTKNENGEIVFYEDNKGIFKHVYYEKDVRISVKNGFDTINRLNYTKRIETVDVSINGDDLNIKFQAILEIDKDYLFYTNRYEHHSTYMSIEYNSGYFEEIYYKDLHNNKTIIHSDLLYDLFNYKWILDKYRIVLHSNNYRKDNYFSRENNRLYLY